MAENTKEDEQASAKAPQSPSKLIPVILVANTLLMGAVLAVVLLRKPGVPSATVAATTSTPPAPASGAAPEKAATKGSGVTQEPATPAGDTGGAPGPILKLDNFIIQLRGADTDRYVRVAFDLELAAESDRSLIKAYMPHIRDAIISYFSDRSLDELRGSEGMDRIKLAVAKRLDEILGPHHVRSVFITELVIQ